MYRGYNFWVKNVILQINRNECVHDSSNTSDLSFSLNHDNVVAKLGLDWRVCVVGSIHSAGLQLEGSVLKRSHH